MIAGIFNGAEHSRAYSSRKHKTGTRGYQHFMPQPQPWRD